MSASQLIKATRFNPRDLPKSTKLSLSYGTASTKFGNCLMAFRGDVLCYLNFFDAEPPLDDLRKTWSKATLLENAALIAVHAKKLFDGNSGTVELFLKGTDFQVEVWESLLKLRRGTTCSYGEIAKAIGKPSSVRAVASAISRNNIAYFVPCHRVIRKDGSVHKYRSGAERKVKMLEDEGAI